MKPKNVANWLLDRNKSDRETSNIERMCLNLGYDEVKAIRRKFEDIEIMKEREMNR